jgi:hypothetical protein
MSDAAHAQQQPQASDAPALSPLHAMLAGVERDTHPHRINRIANDPSVYPWVKFHALGRIDVSPYMSKLVVLGAEHGVIAFEVLSAGLYEAHSQVLPAGRGPWALLFAHACLHKMFTQSDALEIVTRVPKGNLAARTLARACGFRPQFVRPADMGGWVHQGDPIPAEVFSLTIFEWLTRAPGLVERGRWFHDKLESEFNRLGKTEAQHADDETHDRYVGAAVEMVLGGTLSKAAILYNRFAAMSGYAPVSIVSHQPPTIDIQSAIVCFRNNDFWVMSCR